MNRMVEFNEEDGIKLVNDFSDVKLKIKELTKLEKEFAEKLLNYSKQFNTEVILGSDKKCSIVEYDKLVLPENKDKLIGLMRDKGIWDEFSIINFFKFRSSILKDEIDKDIKKEVKITKEARLSLSKKD